MAAYKIIYFNDWIKSEAVFMKGLRGAKTSSSSLAPSCTYRIELRDIADRLWAEKNHQWTEQVQ